MSVEVMFIYSLMVDTWTKRTMHCPVLAECMAWPSDPVGMLPQPLRSLDVVGTIPRSKSVGETVQFESTNTLARV